MFLFWGSNAGHLFMSFTSLLFLCSSEMVIFCVSFRSDWPVCWFLCAALHSAEVQLGWTMYLFCVVFCFVWFCTVCCVESLTCASAVEECSESGCLALSLLELLALNVMFVFISSVLVLVEVRTSLAERLKVITWHTRG